MTEQEQAALPFGLRPVINAAGTMTYLGASRVAPRVIDAMSRVLPAFVNMSDLQRRASRVIARATGGEAGCVTASAAAGISVAVAACMTGDDLYRIEQLPDTLDGKSEVIVQKGHVVGYGASLSQAIRLTGATCIEIGAVSGCAGYQLRGAINERTAAVVYVVSHHTVQTGMIGLRDCCAMAAEYGVPVIVDAASEYDLTGFLAAGAALAIYSGHKFLGGPTSGIIAGRKPLVRTCYMQEKGIGRGMKVGKESIVGAMEALEAWLARDADAIRAAEEARIARAEQTLGALEGMRVFRIADPTGNPIVRLAVAPDPLRCGLDASALSRLLAAGEPSVRVRAHEAELGYFQLDPCNVTDEEMDVVCARIAELVRGERSKTSGAAPTAPTPADAALADLLRWPD
ncbi:PLP-dependent aminotransferase family protein [Paenibacillus cymbidii]|uniref:PLP-dependent transferase n=1 Tax=Paenibacillus cymbidii TaxID=1639034 RepID=UPI001081D645|nr:PLP-dependent transferase [Paenibacillus cymbidii]